MLVWTSNFPLFSIDFQPRFLDAQADIEFPAMFHCHRLDAHHEQKCLYHGFVYIICCCFIDNIIAMDKGVTHLHEEGDFREDDVSPWPFTHTPGYSNNGLQHNNSLGTLTGLTNPHQILGNNLLVGLTQFDNTWNNSGQYNLQPSYHQNNMSLLGHQHPTSEGLKCATMAENQMEATNRFLSEFDGGEGNNVGMSTAKETKNGKGRGKGKGRKRKGKGPAEKAKATFGEESKVLFVVAPLHDINHDIMMISSNTHYKALWNYLKTCMREDSDDLFGDVGMDGSIAFGDELMIVAMEFLCSLSDMRNGITNSGVDVRRRVTEKQYSTGIISLLNVCHFMSAR